METRSPQANNSQWSGQIRRRKYRSKWHRFWKRYGPTVEFLGVCALILAVLVFGIGKLIGNATQDPQLSTEPATQTPTELQTDPPTEPPTAPPTEPITEAPTAPPETVPPTEAPTAAPDPVIYLTFDDGPGSQTPRLLEILAKYNAKATFFVVDTAYASVITQIAEAGHTLAMHTATHEFSKVYASEENYFADLYKIQSVIEQYSGQKPNLLRFPGGGGNTISKKYNEGIMTRLTQLVEEKGFVYFDWSVDSNDAGGAKTAEEVARNVIEGCTGRRTPVVLLHDIHTYTVDAIEEILIWGLENGYTFQGLTADSPTFHHRLNN